LKQLQLTDLEKFSKDIEPIFKFKVKKVVPLVFALSVIAGPSLAWGWGEGGCSKDKANQETKTEQVEETDA
jgi:hypothetical protein